MAGTGKGIQNGLASDLEVEALTKRRRVFLNAAKKTGLVRKKKRTAVAPKKKKRTKVGFWEGMKITFDAIVGD